MNLGHQDGLLESRTRFWNTEGDLVMDRIQFGVIKGTVYTQANDNGLVKDILRFWTAEGGLVDGPPKVTWLVRIRTNKGG